LRQERRGTSDTRAGRSARRAGESSASTIGGQSGRGKNTAANPLVTVTKIPWAVRSTGVSRHARVSQGRTRRPASPRRQLRQLHSHWAPPAAGAARSPQTISQYCGERHRRAVQASGSCPKPTGLTSVGSPWRAAVTKLRPSSCQRNLDRRGVAGRRLLQPRAPTNPHDGGSTSRQWRNLAAVSRPQMCPFSAQSLARRGKPTP